MIDIRPDTEQEQTLQSATHFHLDNILVHYQNLSVMLPRRVKQFINVYQMLEAFLTNKENWKDLLSNALSYH